MSRGRGRLVIEHVALQNALVVQRESAMAANGHSAATGIRPVGVRLNAGIGRTTVRCAEMAGAGTARDARLTDVIVLPTKANAVVARTNGLVHLTSVVRARAKVVDLTDLMVSAAKLARMSPGKR